MDEPGPPAAAPRDGAPGRSGPAGPLLRRIRRTADLSQRELARALGVGKGVLADAETGRRDLAVSLLARAAELAGLRLALLDDDGQEVAGMTDAAVRDRAGRRYPAHLDVRYGDEAWWYSNQRYDREQPWYTFDRSRQRRDFRRTRTGPPDDHQRPRPGDSPGDRQRARSAARWAARAEQAALARAARRRAGLPDPPDPLALLCTCPPGCDDLLLADDAPGPWTRPPVHVDGCPCRCDVS